MFPICFLYSKNHCSILITLFYFLIITLIITIECNSLKLHIYNAINKLIFLIIVKIIPHKIITFFLYFATAYLRKKIKRLSKNYLLFLDVYYLNRITTAFCLLFAFIVYIYDDFESVTRDTFNRMNRCNENDASYFLTTTVLKYITKNCPTKHLI